MSAPTQARPLSFRLARLAAFGAALGLILVFKAQASAQDQPADSAAQGTLQVTVETTEPEVRSVQFDDGWVMEIRPAQTSRVLVNGHSYTDVYGAIPYRRSEYLANPSYRHDATLEILAGQLRPTVIHRNDTPVRIENPRPQMYKPYIPSTSDLWRATRYTLAYPFMPYSIIPPLNP